MKARRPWAWPLVPLYRLLLAGRSALRAARVSRPKRLSWPVISVGSLSVGGAGKTPVTIALASLLSERGWTVDVLSRGYRRMGHGIEEVDLRTEDPARRFGDEPTLIAQRTGVPVWVGGSRFTAGQAAESKLDAAHQGNTTPRVHLLDDGLQHQGLARTFDLVLVTAADLGDTLLPAGNLREPLQALRRADALAVREEELSRVLGPLRTMVGREVPIWTVRRSLRFPPPLGIFGAGLRPLAFCGLARPENFATMLAKAGCGVVDTVIFPDHHRYTERDILTLIEMAKTLEASGLITTEKDAVKLSAAALARLEEEVGPVVVTVLDAAFVYESPVVRTLAERLDTLAPDRLVGDSDEVPSR